MVATVGSIKVAFDADLRAYEASLRKGEKSTDRFERNANKATAGVGNAFIKMGGLAKAGLAGLAAGIFAGGVTGIVSKLGDVAKGIAEIGDQAKRAGVSLKSFQEWKFVAEQNRIGIDQMTDGLKELNLRADEFISSGGKSGSAAEAFQRLGYTSQDLAKKLKDPSALLLEIIDRLGKFDKAAQIRISDEVFGGSAGERFVELLAQGKDGIRDTIQRAHDLGAVMDDEVIERAAELDRKFNAITTTVGTGLKTAIVEAAGALQDFIDTFQGWWESYQKRLAASQLGTLAGSLAGTTTPPGPPDPKTTPKTDRLPKKEWTPPKPPPGGFGSGGGGSSSRDRAAAKAEREAEAVRRLIDELEHEKSLIGATDLERDISNTLRQAGAAATDDQRAKIVSLVAAIHAETEAQRQAADAMDLYRDIAGGVMNDLRNALSDGKLSWEELGDVALNVLNKIVDKLLNDVLDAIFKVGNAGSGLGGGGGLFSALGGMIGEGRTFPGQSCGRTERVDDLPDRIVPCMEDLGSGVIAGDGDKLDMAADAVSGNITLDQRVDVLRLTHGFHEVDRVGTEAIAA